MKALVTGCAGFIGSHLVDKLLEQGYEVIGVDCFTDYYPREIKEKNLSNALKSRDFKFIEKDILEMDKFPDVDYVFHLAAQAGVRASWGKSFEIYTRNNIEATQKLLEFYKERQIKKFVYASSSSVYGDAKLPMRKDSLLKPVSPYGVTKLAGENLCYLYWKNYKVPTVSLRYFTVYGPRQRPDMAIHKFVKAILNGDEITVFGDGTQTRDFTYVDDAVEANILAANNNVVGEIFNIGGGSRISVNDLIGMMENIIGKKAKVKYIEKQKGDVRDTLADVSKAQKELRWKPKIDIFNGLREYMGWYIDGHKF
ncbi:MAG: NAD-dependent epimerase/dehydratase family protein [Methanophagales archaeon]|nr:NAD-dependent epimerase/dehydratase family protein [Methanophagales archaeon]